MKVWVPIIFALTLILSASIYLNQSLNDEEKTILVNGPGLIFYQQLELISVFHDTNLVRDNLLDKYIITGDSEYYRSYVDSGYTLNNFYNLTKKRKLTNTELNILIITLKANNAYYSNHTSLKYDGQIGVFSPKTPYPNPNIFINSKFSSKMPFVYYKGKGWQFYPVTATFWASEYFNQGKYSDGIDILDELSPFMAVEDYNGMKYGVFNVYFQYSNSSIPWASSYSQGMAAGLYAQAYNKTNNKKILGSVATSL